MTRFGLMVIIWHTGILRAAHVESEATWLGCSMKEALAAMVVYKPNASVTLMFVGGNLTQCHHRGHSTSRYKVWNIWTCVNSDGIRFTIFNLLPHHHSWQPYKLSHVINYTHSNVKYEYLYVNWNLQLHKIPVMMAECRMALRILILLAGSSIWFFWARTLEQTSSTW